MSEALHDALIRRLDTLDRLRVELLEYEGAGELVVSVLASIEATADQLAAMAQLLRLDLDPESSICNGSPRQLDPPCQRRLNAV